MRKLISKILVGILTLFLAGRFISGIYLREAKSIILVGAILGLFSFFLKPILKFIFLPFRLLTFNLFSILINVGLVKLVDFIFLEFEIKGILPLLAVALIFWVLEFILK